MKRIAFRMKIFEGCAQEYKKRHDQIWKKLQDLLIEKGIRDFSIFLDEERGDLFAYIEAGEDNRLADLPGEPVQKEWWAYMRDIMETNDDNSPVQTGLREVFHLSSENK